MTEPNPQLYVVGGPTAGARVVVLLLHGGAEANSAPAGRGPAYLRMLPFGWSILRATRGGTAVWLLRNRYQGWNEPDLPAVADARWALEQARQRHPDATIVLVGHSMGGRVALRVADAPGVVAVCALAPWITAGEPTAQLVGRTVLIVHGDRDTTTDPGLSAAYAAAVGARFIGVPGSGHAMLRRYRRWSALVTQFVTGVPAEPCG